MNDQDRVILTNDYFAEHAKDIEKVLQRAVNHALLMHKRLGNPIAVWKDGRVVIIPPEEIVISPEYVNPEQ
jgi:ABC-type proline/glycine betaine transport system ATPase subunit